jgi:lysine-N-methylase
MRVRPRLAEHALVRRHVVDGVEKLVIHDARSGSLAVIDERALSVALAADGTRDVGGIALAVVRAGHYRRMSEIESVLAALDGLGLLADGIELEAPVSPTAGTRLAPLEGDAGSRSVVALPDYHFRCDGAGGCCAQYGSVAFTDRDEARARRAGLATLPDDVAERRVFLPLAGGTTTGRSAMTLIDGACLQREPDGRCGLHVLGGAGAKPVGCSTYPRTLVDDGVEIRAAVALECDCVFSSLGDPSRARPFEAEAATGAELAYGVVVRSLPATIALTSVRTASASELSAWSAAFGRLEVGDALAQACALAELLEAEGLVAPELALAGASTISPGSEGARRVAARAAELAASLEAAAASAAAWRSARDRTRRMREALASVATRVATTPSALDAVLADGAYAEAESLALRSAVFGHLLAGNTSVADGLRDLAARFVLARALGRTDLGHPLAVVMATLGGLG